MAMVVAVPVAVAREEAQMDAHKMLIVIVCHSVKSCHNMSELFGTKLNAQAAGATRTRFNLSCANKSKPVPRHLYRSTCFEGFRRIRWQLEWLDNETFKLEHGTHPPSVHHGHVIFSRTLGLPRLEEKFITDDKMQDLWPAMNQPCCTFVFFLFCCWYVGSFETHH